MNRHRTAISYNFDAKPENSSSWGSFARQLGCGVLVTLGGFGIYTGLILSKAEEWTESKKQTTTMPQTPQTYRQFNQAQMEMLFQPKPDQVPWRLGPHVK